MQNKRVRPGLSSPDQSEDVEFTNDKQIDEGQHEREEKEGRGPLGPPNTDSRYRSKGKPLEVDEQTPENHKQHRGTLP